MSEEVRPPKILVVVTALVFICLLVVGSFVLSPKLPDSIPINTKGQPTIGYTKAPVHVVLFEEPKCSNCRDFNLQIFPKIKETFIDTNKIRYTVIPVSFLPGSMPAAVALLCVYHGDPLYPNDDLYFTYFDYLYEHQPDEYSDWASTEQLLEFAKDASPAINLEKLKKCVDKEVYRSKIRQNTAYGAKIMGGTISTPTIYVNGIEVQEITFDQISELIQKCLDHAGGH